MTSSDPIADMLTRIRNAGMARHEFVALPDSKVKFSVADILRQAGYLATVERIPAVPQGTIRLRLRFDGTFSVIKGIRRISRPGRRVYVGVGEIPKVKNGLGICIVSTSRGIMTGQQAKRLGVGGELLCEVW